MDIKNLRNTVKPSAPDAISKLLDNSDGKKDKKINASVWNNFVKDKGGKQIKYSISLENAQKSISIYLERESKKTGKSKEELSVKWLMDIGKHHEVSQNDIGSEMEANLKKERTSPEAIKSRANAATKWIQLKSESIPMVNADTAAQEFHQVVKNLKGKFPMTLATKVYVDIAYPKLVQQAKSLGIDAPSKVNYSSKGEKDRCKETLNACVALKNKILVALNKKKV